MDRESNTHSPKLLLALRRGLAGRCPGCGEARLFGRFLKPVAACLACGRDWTVQRSDDFPAYLAVLIAGHILVPLVVMTNQSYDPPMITQMIVWPTAAALLALLLIQPMKGFVIALIWAR